MTPELISQWAREVGWPDEWVDAEELQAFAALVAAHEREICAKVCDERAAYYDQGDDDGPESRRGRSSKACAAAIRARGT